MTVKKKIFIPLMDDLMFKYLFGYQDNIEFTEYLLELLLGYENGYLHNKIEITNSLKLDKDNYFERGLELDIGIKMIDDTIINLECYNTFGKIAKIKSLMYLSKLFSTQLEPGEKLNNVKRHLQINLVKDKYAENQNYLILSQNNKTYLNNLFEIRVINVEKNNEIEYNNNLSLTAKTSKARLYKALLVF